jgi:hypothetical protein
MLPGMYFLRSCLLPTSNYFFVAHSRISLAAFGWPGQRPHYFRKAENNLNVTLAKKIFAEKIFAQKIFAEKV